MRKLRFVFLRCIAYLRSIAVLQMGSIQACRVDYTHPPVSALQQGLGLRSSCRDLTLG